MVDNGKQTTHNLFIGKMNGLITWGNKRTPKKLVTKNLSLLSIKELLMMWKTNLSFFQNLMFCFLTNFPVFVNSEQNFLNKLIAINGTEMYMVIQIK